MLPPALHLGQFDSEFLSGYPAVLDVWTALVGMIGPDKAFAHTGQLTNLGWWEFDLFVGLIGAAFLIYFGLAWWLKKRDVPAWLNTAGRARAGVVCAFHRERIQAGDVHSHSIDQRGTGQRAADHPAIRAAYAGGSVCLPAIFG